MKNRKIQLNFYFILLMTLICAIALGICINDLSLIKQIAIMVIITILLYLY